MKEETLISGINNLAEELNVDVLVTGCQEVEDDGMVMILGELCDSSFWKKDTVVVKSTSFEATQPLKFLLGAHGTGEGERRGQDTVSVPPGGRGDSRPED